MCAKRGILSYFCPGRIRICAGACASVCLAEISVIMRTLVIGLRPAGRQETDSTECAESFLVLSRVRNFRFEFSTQLNFGCSCVCGHRG